MEDETDKKTYDVSGDVTLGSYESDAAEKRRWDLLKWRPRLKTISAVYWDFGIPKDAYEARMSLLEPEDRATLEHAFSCKGDGKFFKYRFFGSDADKKGDMDWRPTASACARTTMDADSALRLFKASAAFDGDRERDGRNVLNSEGRLVTYDAGAKYKAWMAEFIRYVSIDSEITSEREASGAKLSFDEKLCKKSANAFSDRGSEK